MRELFIVLLVFVVAGCGPAVEPEPEPDPAAEADDLYQSAVAADEAGKFGDSEELLEQIVAQHSSSTAADDASEMLARVRESSEAAALEAVRDIIEAQVIYMATQRRYGLNVEDLVGQILLPEDPSRAGLGYRFSLRGSPSADSYTLTAEPSSGVGEKRSFFADSTGVIRSELGQPATVESPELDADSDRSSLWWKSVGSRAGVFGSQARREERNDALSS